MFGYIRPDTPELRVRENEFYRAAYCGLCRAQGKCTGQCSRMTLSYDIVFLALLRLAVSDERVELKRGRCLAHPFKKRAYLTLSEPLRYSAYTAALLTFAKCSDDLADERGFKRLKARLTMPVAKSMRKKVPECYRGLDELIRNKLAELAALEKKKLPSVDAPADLFGDILSEVLSYGLDGNDARILRSIGKHVGRWIYIVDAADDFDEDLQKNRYNPFACLYGGTQLTDEQKREFSISLRLELSAAEPAFDLLDFEEKYTIEGIIKNIIYRGMPHVADRVLCLDGTERQTKRQKKRGQSENG